MFLHYNLIPFVGHFKSFSNFPSPCVEIKMTKHKGWGLFVIYNPDYPHLYKKYHNRIYLKKGTEITTYGGKFWYKDDWKTYKQKKLKEGATHEQFEYALQVTSLFLIDAWELPDNFFDFAHLANHSKAHKANTKFIIKKNNELYPHLSAIEDILVGKECKAHYSDYFDDIFQTSSSESNDCDSSDVNYK